MSNNNNWGLGTSPNTKAVMNLISKIRNEYDIEAIKKLISKMSISNLNQVIDGNTALMTASMIRNRPIVELLLDHGRHHRLDRFKRRPRGGDWPWDGIVAQHQRAAGCCDLSHAFDPALGHSKLYHRPDVEGYVPPTVWRDQSSHPSFWRSTGTVV